MTNFARQVLNDALQLSLEERAQVVADLIASFDGDPDANVESAWEIEIKRRITGIDHGNANLEDWSRARKALLPKP